MLEAVRGLVAQGIELHAVVPWRDDLAGELERLGVAVHVVPYTWWVGRGRWRAVQYKLKRAGRNLFYLPRLRRIINGIKPDAVVSNTLAAPTGALAARRAGIPHVWYVHEFFGKEGHDLFFDWGERFSLFMMDKLSDKIIVNSEGVFRRFAHHLAPNKLRVVHSSVDVPPLEAPEVGAGDGLSLIQVGLLSPGKQQETAVRAVGLLAAKGLNVRLKLLGDEALGDEGLDYESMLRNLCAELGVGNRVEFAPFSRDPFSHMAAADVVLICSRGEAFGRVTVEAMKLGRAVIGAESAGTADLISDGETGLLFRLGDAADLSLKIEMLYRNHSLAREIGARARNWATREFSQEKFIGALIQVFEEVAERPTSID